MSEPKHDGAKCPVCHDRGTVIWQSNNPRFQSEIRSCPRGCVGGMTPVGIVSGKTYDLRLNVSQLPGGEAFIKGHQPPNRGGEK